MFARLGGGRGKNLFVELLMIVVGINIALWFEGWFESLQEAETEQVYLHGLRDDLRVDIEKLEAIIRGSEAKLSKLGEMIPKIDQLPEASGVEQAQAIFEPSGYEFFDPSDFTYRSMQESGDFRLLSDDDIKTGILRLARQYRVVDMLQKNFMQALDDEYIPLMLRGFDIISMQITDPELVKSQVFRNFFAFAYQDTETRLKIYRRARDQAEELLEKIEAQIEPA